MFDAQNKSVFDKLFSSALKLGGFWQYTLVVRQSGGNWTGPEGTEPEGTEPEGTEPEGTENEGNGPKGTGLDQKGLNQRGVDWRKRDWSGPEGTVLEGTGLDRTGLDQNGVDWKCLDWARGHWTRLGQGRRVSGSDQQVERELVTGDLFRSPKHQCLWGQLTPSLSIVAVRARVDCVLVYDCIYEAVLSPEQD